MKPELVERIDWLFERISEYQKWNSDPSLRFWDELESVLAEARTMAWTDFAEKRT